MTTFGDIANIHLPDCISSIDFSKAGDYFAVGCIDESLSIWKANFEPFDEAPILSRSGHTMGVIDVKFNDKGTKVAVSSLDSIIRVWDVATSDLAIEIQCQPLENWKLCFPDRNIITAGELGRISMYDSVSGERTGSLKSSQHFGSAITISPNDNFLALGASNGGIFVFNRKSDNKMGKYQLHHKQIRSLVFTEDSSKLVTASDDQTIKIFDVQTEKPIAELSGHKSGITCVDSHPTDNKIIISSSFDKSIKMWDIRNKHSTGSIQHHNTAVWTAKFNSTGNHIASGSEAGILAIHCLK